MIIIGMIHLLPLPGSPLSAGSLQEVLDAALLDARALGDGGVDAVMMENYGDIPFRKGPVEPHTVAAMAVVAREIRREIPLPLGINVLRNDARSALAIAGTVGAEMIRVNVHVGAAVTDQGIIEGDAAGTIEYRRRLGADVRIMADVNVKHGRPLADVPIEEAAADAAERGLADALIITGSRTGAPADPGDLERVRSVTTLPIYVGSGVTPDAAAYLVGRADGVIVGSWLKRDGNLRAPVDVDRVRRLVEVCGK